MDAGTALQEAFDRLRSRDGLLLVVAFLAVGVVTVVARQTLLATSLTAYLAGGGDPAALPVDPDQLRPIALALPISYGPSVLLFALVAVVYEYLTIVTLRVVADTPLGESATRRVPGALAAGIVVGVIVKTLVGVGLLAFVVPGVFFASALLFAHARVAIDDEGAIAALRGTWRETEGRRLTVVGIVAVLAALYLTPRVLSGLVPGAGVSLLVGGALIGMGNLLSVALVARAHLGFRTERETEEANVDPYDAPLGPDDLPEP